MSHLTKNKIIVYLAAIFLVGGVTGAVLGWTGAKERWSQPPDGKKISYTDKRGSIWIIDSAGGAPTKVDTAFRGRANSPEWLTPRPADHRSGSGYRSRSCQR